MPQAQLLFEDELIAKDQYFPFAGFVKTGTKLSAHRCPKCGLICFSPNAG